MDQLPVYITEFLTVLFRSGWLWGILLGLIALRILVMLYRVGKTRALERLEYDRTFSKDGAFAGDTLEFTETVHNPTWFPLFSVEVFFYIPSGISIDEVECREYTRITSIFHVPPRATVRKKHIVHAKTRGLYRLDNVSILYRKNEFFFSVPICLYVYPNYTSIKAEDAPDLYRVGNHISSRKYAEDPFFLSGIRPYRVGDPMRSINFKASVRSFSYGCRQLMSNDYDSSRNFDSMIFFDLFSGDEQTREETKEFQLELGLSYATYLLLETIGQGGAVGFASNCASGVKPYVHIPCGIGSLHGTEILKSFAEIAYTGRDYSICSLLERFTVNLPNGTDLYLITPFVDARTAETIRRLERIGINAVVILLRGKARSL